MVDKQSSCKIHGDSRFVSMGKGKNQRFRCAQCNVDRVTRRRRSLKLEIVNYYGGKCTQCRI